MLNYFVVVPLNFSGRCRFYYFIFVECEKNHEKISVWHTLMRTERQKKRKEICIPRIAPIKYLSECVVKRLFNIIVCTSHTNIYERKTQICSMFTVECHPCIHVSDNDFPIPIPMTVSLQQTNKKKNKDIYGIYRFECSGDIQIIKRNYYYFYQSNSNVFELFCCKSISQYCEI